jgi:hypothetical protein
MNRSIAEKALLVMVLVTLMGAGAMSSADNSRDGSAQSRAAKGAAPINSTAGSATGNQLASPHAICLEERLATFVTSHAGQPNRSMRAE